MSGKVLIVDDEPDIRELLQLTLGRMSLDTTGAADVESAKRILESETFDLCLTDMRLPDGDGLDLVELIQNKYSNMPVAVITAHGSTETAIRALKNGAFDFVSKPVDLQKLRFLVDSAMALSTTGNSIPTTAEVAENTDPQSSITGESEKIEAMRQQISRLARTQAPVYVSGESGSGKELAARAIHNQSARRQAPFVAVNCGAIPEELMESELFGHLKGSFTGADHDKQGLFEAAKGGTLFLDEIADLPLHTQVKLLRVIQEKAFRAVGSQKETPTNIRIVSATHKNLAHEVEEGNFRQDLYYRINVIELAVPSLRERVEDIPALSESIMKKIALENQQPVCQLTADAMETLGQYDFPGNVRELENILQRAVALCENQNVTSENLNLMENFRQQSARAAQPVDSPTASPQPSSDHDYSLEKHLEAIEIKAIEQALEETRWNKTKAAKKLGMSFRSLRYRLKKLGLD
ncbi:MAG: sigma-54-dependent Fis family transcriptional regulator [Gammaproteobacteria bacterium]|nr:sigma-54-dependent Fis family transcriptional regulator [Gammaproteobacteria bacterium]